MDLLRSARSPRKTMVIGTISDYSGKGGDTHRKVARQALDVTDRVIFVGPQASHVSKLRQEEVRDRLFAFVTSYQAAAFSSSTSRPRSPIISNESCSRSSAMCCAGESGAARSQVARNVETIGAMYRRLLEC